MADLQIFVEDGEEAVVALLVAQSWYVHFGTSDQEAVKGDTALIAASPEARTLAVATNVDPDVAQFVGSITDTTGQTIKELGLFDAATNGTLIARGNLAAGYATMLAGDVMEITVTIALS